MTAIRKIHICVSDSLLEEVDSLVQAERKNRSALIREAVRHYLRERRHQLLARQMRDGYRAMGAINRELAEEAASVDSASLEDYEKKLAELWGTPQDASRKAQG